MRGTLRTSTAKLIGERWPEACVLQFLCVDDATLDDLRAHDVGMPHFGGLDQDLDMSEASAESLPSVVERMTSESGLSSAHEQPAESSASSDSNHDASAKRGWSSDSSHNPRSLKSSRVEVASVDSEDSAGRTSSVPQCSQSSAADALDSDASAQLSDPQVAADAADSDAFSFGVPEPEEASDADADEFWDCLWSSKCPPDTVFWSPEMGRDSDSQTPACASDCRVSDETRETVELAFIDVATVLLTDCPRPLTPGDVLLMTYFPTTGNTTAVIERDMNILTADEIRAHSM